MATAKFLYELADEITETDWLRFARIRLGLVSSEINNIEANYKHNAQERKFQMLQLWTKKNPGTKFEQEKRLKKYRDHFLHGHRQDERDTLQGADQGTSATTSSKAADSNMWLRSERNSEDAVPVQHPPQQQQQPGMNVDGGGMLTFQRDGINRTQQQNTNQPAQCQISHNQIISRGESKPGVSSATAPAFAEMLSFLQSSGGLPPDIGKQDSAKSAHSSPTNRRLSHAEHSTDVIHKCYRKTTSENSTSPASVGSPNTPRSGSNVGVEPISPPEGHFEASNAPVKKPQQSTTTLTLQRFPTQPLQTQSERNMLSSRPRPPAQIQGQHPLIPPQTLPAQSMGIPLSQLNPCAPPPHFIPAAVGGNSSLEDIIRKALMDGSTWAELRQADQMMAGLQVRRIICLASV